MGLNILDRGCLQKLVYDCDYSMIWNSVSSIKII